MDLDSRPVVYVSIGNSDDKLTQQEWAQFVQDTYDYLRAFAHKMHGDWRSASDSPWQNACWCVEFDNIVSIAMIRHNLARLARRYHQDSIAWAVAETEFIAPLAEGQDVR